MRKALCMTLRGAVVAACLAAVWHAPAMAGAPERWLALSDGIFQPLGMAEGLPNLEIITIAQDGQGFLWVGSSDGISRWDGYRFRDYRAGSAASGSLPDNFVRVLHTDGSGRLWVGMATGGIASYDPQTDGFNSYPVENAGDGRLEVMAIADDGAGGVWVGGGDGLYHLDMSGGSVRAVVMRDGDHVLPQGRVYSVLHDRGGRLWVGTGHGVFRRDASGENFRLVRLPIPPESLPVVGALMQDAAGRVWIGTSGAGAFVVAPDDSVRQVTEPDALPERVQTLDVESLAEVRPGEVWLGTSGDGIVSVLADTLQTGRIRHDPLRPTSLADDAVWALQQDRAGAIWVGTNRGLGRFDPGQTGILTVFGGAGLRTGIADPDVMSVMALPDGHVWLGLQRHDVAILDPGSANPSALPHDARLPNAIVTALADIADSGAFIATWRGLFKADLGLHHLEKIPLPGVPVNHAVSDLTADGRTLWIGTIDGLFRLDAGASGAADVVRKVPLDGKLTDNRVRVILPAGGGPLWIGTWDGLNLFDPATGEVRRLRADAANPAALSAGLITSCLTDRQGRLWVATSGGGINVLSGRLGDPSLRIRRIGTADGLPNANVDKLLVAPDGQIWASTDDGLARIDPISLRVAAFHLAEGVAISTYWADSGTVTPQGELLFGGTGGLTVVRPDRLTEVPQNLSLAVTDLRVGGQSVPAGRLNSEVPKTPLVIQPDANSLAVEFSALHFADPTRYRYDYWLQGVDHGWVESDAARRLAAYTNLPPGALNLLLRVSDPAGVQAPVVMRVPILVLPSWYQTWWFTFVALVGSLGLVLLLLRLQTAWMKKRQSALQRLVEERTAALRKSNEALAHSASTLSELAEIGQQVTASHDAETILEVLHEHVCRLLDARHFAVFLVQGAAQLLILRFGMRDGVRLSPDAPLEPWHAEQMSCALRERREIVVEVRSRPNREPSLISHRVYAPLIVLDRVIGALLIEYDDRDPMAERERMIVRTISAYGAIALDNAEILDALAQAQSRLELLAFSDGLTNLPNRRVYIEEFERFRAQAVAESGEFALLLIDLDRFKQINDTFGHDVGDAMLVETARRLQLAVRAGDVVMRLGGDEFAILLSEVEGVQGVARVCRRIVESFRAEIRVNGVVVQASTSIGVAVYPDDGDGVELLYKAADIALYEAKRAGRNTWRKFEPSLAGTGGEVG